MRKGITLIELLIALLLAGLVVGFAVTILRDETSNMIHVRSRVQSQTAARDGMKILESELRAAGFGVAMTPSASPGDPTLLTSVSPTCPDMIDAARQSSIIAMDGANGGNDTLDLAYSLKVSPSKGAECSFVQVRWVRYLVKNSDLVRYEGASRVVLSTNNVNSTIVGKNVDVFQVELGASGISKNGKVLLSGADSCCPGSTWQTTNVTVAPSAAAGSDELTTAGAWSYLSKEKDLSMGEMWRLRFIVQDASAALLKDLIDNAPTAFVNVGLYSSSGTGDVLLPILSQPTNAPTGFGKLVEADLVVPVSGKYRIGLSGNSSGKLVIEGFNAMAVRLGADSLWLKTPSKMNPDDWSRVKSVRVQVLTRAPADKKDYHSKFTGLSNFIQKSGAPLGEFNVTDTSIRVLLDHVYPAGNNGRF